MKHLGLVQIALAMILGVSTLWAGAASAGPDSRYGVLLNVGYTSFEPDGANLSVEQDDDTGFRIGVFYDLDGDASQGFEFDVSWVNFGSYEYCLRGPITDPAQISLSGSRDGTTRIGRLCNKFEADGFQIGATYVIPLGRLSRSRSVLDKFAGFVAGGYSDLDFNPEKTLVAAFDENDESFYWEAGLLWTGGFGDRAKNFGLRFSYRAHDNNGIEYLSLGFVWDLR